MDTEVFGWAKNVMTRMSLTMVMEHEPLERRGEGEEGLEIARGTCRLSRRGRGEGGEADSYFQIKKPKDVERYVCIGLHVYIYTCT